MTPAQKATRLLEYIHMIKAETRQAEVLKLCNRAIEEADGGVTRRGRRRAVGKYSSNEELIRWVLFYYYKTEQNQLQVAKTCDVSQGTVNKIIETHGKDWREWI